MDNFEKIIQLYEENNFDEINNIIKNNSIDDNNELLFQSAKSGYIEIVKLLIPLSDCKAQDSYALKIAAYNGNIDIVNLLIPHSDTKSQNSDPLKWAVINDNIDIVKLLIPHSEVDIVINKIKDNTLTHFQENINKSIEIMNNYLNQKQKVLLLNLLNKEVTKANIKSKRKI